MNRHLLTMAIAATALAAPLPGRALTAATILDDTASALTTGDTRAELDAARREVDQARLEIENAQREVELAQARIAREIEIETETEPADPPEAPEPVEPPEPPPLPEIAGFPDIDAIVNGAMAQVHTALGGPFGAGAGTPLVVADGLDAARLGELQEDLSVMARILTKAAGKTGGSERNRVAMGIRLQLPFGQSGPTSLYLDGYGAVFFLNVNYPLVPPPPKAEPKREPEKPVDTAWEEARAELYGGPQARRSTGIVLGTPGSEKQLDYDTDRVDALKTALLGVLKNASNIRHMKPDEQILLVVQGAGQPSAKRTGHAAGESWSARGPQGAKAPAAGTLLSMRVKKANADAAAEGKLEVKEFAKQVRVWAN